MKLIEKLANYDVLPYSFDWKKQNKLKGSVNYWKDALDEVNYRIDNLEQELDELKQIKGQLRSKIKKEES